MLSRQRRLVIQLFIRLLAPGEQGETGKSDQRADTQGQADANLRSPGWYPPEARKPRRDAWRFGKWIQRWRCNGRESFSSARRRTPDRSRLERYSPWLPGLRPLQYCESSLPERDRWTSPSVVHSKTVREPRVRDVRVHQKYPTKSMEACTVLMIPIQALLASNSRT